MREILIIFFILIIIIIGTIYTHKYIDKTTSIIVSSLEYLKVSIEQGNLSQEELKKESEDMYKKWDKINENWSNIVLHDEIDLIETSLTRVKSKINIGNLNESLEEIEVSIFLVNHIKEKEKTSLKNIL